MLEMNPGEASAALDRVGRNHSSGCARHVSVYLLHDGNILLVNSQPVVCQNPKSFSEGLLRRLNLPAWLNARSCVTPCAELCSSLPWTPPGAPSQAD